MAVQHRSHILASAEDTAHLAQRLAMHLEPGDTILLSGPVGAGKTHFARALIQSILSEPEDVPSPTFTLIQTYETRRGTLWHADLYRVTSTQELEELGLSEAFETAICVVEWPDRLGDMKPRAALDIALATDQAEDTRHLVAEWDTQHWQDRLEGWIP